jgi:CRP/FNR family cyclic AMP-dependent transcriptional regulator
MDCYIILTKGKNLPKKAMLSRMEKIIFLKKVPIFAELNSEILIALSEILNEEYYPANSIIFKENDIGDTLYIIFRGEVEISKTTEDGEKKVLAHLGATDIFGEMGVFDDKPRSATVIALKDTITLTINKAQFRDLIIEYPEIMFEMYRVAIERLRRTNE